MSSSVAWRTGCPRKSSNPLPNLSQKYGSWGETASKNMTREEHSSRQKGVRWSGGELEGEAAVRRAGADTSSEKENISPLGSSMRAYHPYGRRGRRLRKDGIGKLKN